MSNKQLFIAVDPGFDSMKVVANGIVFKFPFNVVETDERKMTDYRLRDDFMLYQDSNGGTYRVGQYARELVFDNKSKVDSFYTEQRFISEEFQVGLNTAIALAIEKNGLCDNQSDLDIYLMVALPHGCRETYAPTIIGLAAGIHKFKLRCGQCKDKVFRYRISEKNVFTVSQTIAAILGETSDDAGNVDEDKFFYLSNGPTLVLDGGYYTMGMVVVSRGGSVDESKTESDTQHAMSNVNQLIADAIKDKRPDINHYAIEYLLSKDDGIIRYMADGKAAAIDVHELRRDKVKEVCTSLINYLDNKYNNLLDFKYVLVTGGTGAAFYKQLLDFYSSAGLLDSEHLMLTTGMLNDKQYPVEFAITIGAYKGLKGVFSTSN